MGRSQIRQWAGLLLLGVGATLGSVARAQDAPQLLFSDEPTLPADAGKLRTEFWWRPNLADHKVYLFVKNPTGAEAKLRVELRVSPTGDWTKLADVTVKADGLEKVRLGDPAAKPAPAAEGKEAKPAARWKDLKGPPFSFTLRLVDDATMKPVGVEVPVTRILKPHEYLQVKRCEYNPAEQLLTVDVVVTKPIGGPRCPLQLVLPADRLPPQEPNPGADSNLQTEIRLAENQGTELSRSGLAFQFPNPAQERGFIYVTADGYERAFVFRPNFKEGKPATELRDTRIRIVAPAFTQPGQLPVRLEVDNHPGNAEDQIQLALGRKLGRDVKVKRETTWDFSEDEIVPLPPGYRKHTVRYHTDSPDDALTFETKVEDWTVEVDTTGLTGRNRLLQARLLRGSEPATLKNDRDDNVTSALALVTFDTTAPTGRFVTDEGALPRKLVRGQPLRLTVRARDEQSGIRAVAFFTGPPVKGQVPKDAELIPAQPRDGGPDRPVLQEADWSAELPLSTVRKAEFEIGVQVVNGAGLNAVDTIRIELVDPDKPAVVPGAPAPAGAKTFTVSGTVSEGGNAQPDLEVTLTELKDKGMSRTVRTGGRGATAGTFKFEGVPDGPYRVSAAKSGSGAPTRGSQDITVAGKDVTGVGIKLLRGR